MRPAGGEPFSCTTVNVSEVGVCLVGVAPATDSRLDLILPGGQRVAGIEMASVWTRRQSENVVSGWRFTRVRKDVRQALQQELGLDRGPDAGYGAWEENEVELNPGDALTIPGGVEHRVTMTSPHTPTVWLAVHFTAT